MKRCSKCGHTGMSDDASACGQCGHEVVPRQSSKTSDLPSKKLILAVVGVIGALAAVAAMFSKKAEERPVPPVVHAPGWIPTPSDLPADYVAPEISAGALFRAYDDDASQAQKRFIGPIVVHGYFSTLLPDVIHDRYTAILNGPPATEPGVRARLANVTEYHYIVNMFHHVIKLRCGAVVYAMNQLELVGCVVVTKFIMDNGQELPRH